MSFSSGAKARRGRVRAPAGRGRGEVVPSVGRVGDLDDEVHVRAQVIAVLARHRVPGVIDLRQFGPVVAHPARAHRAGVAAEVAPRLEGHQLAAIARRVGIGDVFRDVAKPDALRAQARGGDGGRTRASPRGADRL